MQKKTRADINGLKAVAIIAVVMYHLTDLLRSARLCSDTVFDGGFLGVDIFLVISGFLICKTVTDKLYSGNFSLREFYQRRLLRILPPLLFVCLATLILGYFLLVPDVFLELNREIANALIFSGNFRFANLSGYFALDSSDRVLLHTWYLSLTLQFYLICPLILMSAFRLSKKGYPYLVLGVFLLTFILSVLLSNTSKAYLLTQCRIFELFFGAALYCFHKRATAYFENKELLCPVIEFFSLAGLLLIIYLTRLNNGLYTPSDSLLTMGFTALIIILNSKRSIFSLKFLQFTGSVSYSLYLWHWPLLVFALRCGLLNSKSAIAVSLVVIAVISVLSYYLTEKKVFRLRTVAVMYLLLFAAYGYFKGTDGRNYISDFIREGSTRSQHIVEPREKNLTMSIYVEDKLMPVFHYGRQDLKPDVFIIGDSHADHYSYYFRNVNTYPVYMSVLHATMAYGPVFNSMKKAKLTGEDFRHKYYSIYSLMLDKLSSNSKVILANRWDVGYHQYIFEYDLLDTEDNFKKYLTAMLSDIKSKTKLYQNLKFYLVGQGVITNSVIVNCLRTNLEDSVLRYIIDEKSCAFTPDYQGKRLDLINSALKEFADKNDNVYFIDRNIPQMLGNSLYKTYTPDGAPLYVDDNHYSNSGGIFIGSYIMKSVDSLKY